MHFSQYIQALAKGKNAAKDLSRESALMLYGAMLDGAVPAFELGAIVTALRMKGESADEMQGFLQALHYRVRGVSTPNRSACPVVLPSYNGARKSANLTPLLALLLQRFGVPVLVHGLLEDEGRLTSAQIFRELGLMPTLEHGQILTALNHQGIAFVPVSVLSQGVSDQLALRARTGLRNAAHSLVKMLDPFQGAGFLVMAATHPPYLEMMQALALRTAQATLLLRATEGEPFANPKRCPEMRLLKNGQTEVVFQAEHDSIKTLPELPASADVKPTADWIRGVLDGQFAIPDPLAKQVTACLYGCGHAKTLSEAQDMVAAQLGPGLRLPARFDC